MTEYAHVECQYHELQPYGHYYTYKWIGKRSQPALIDRAFLFSKDVELPWKLLLVEEKIESGHWLVFRKDAFFPVGFLIVTKMKLREAWLWFKYRFILTLSVWGLARLSQGCVPSWKDIGRRK